MATFGDATGQRLNEAKTALLPIGEVPADLPPTAHGLRVVSSATALGVAFGAAADPASRWDGLVDTINACYSKVASLPKLSMFGRGFANAAYGISKALYHAEFTGLPPAAVLQGLDRTTTKLVVRGDARSATSTAFNSVAGWALPGRPANGGFGVLAWPQHITSRHARWALRLILGPADTPWVAVARELLRCCAGGLGDHPLGLLLWPADAPLPGQAAPLPPPLRRIHSALQRLPPPGALDLQPGPWCRAAPLWGNPLIRPASHPAGIDSTFADFAAAGVASLGQLLLLQRAVAAAASPVAYALVHAGQLRGSPAFTQQDVVAERIAALLDALPQSWVEAARGMAPGVLAGTAQPPTPEEGMAALLSHVGWLHRGRPLPLAAFTVRAGTELQLRPVEGRREQHYFAPFAAAASPAGGASSADVLALLERLWRVRWENRRKEPFWRLVFDGLPTAARLHIPRGCQCGAPGPADRQHHYWACPVAQAVVSAISAAAGAALTPAAIWLARPPPGVHGGIWDVVCLSAVAAMDHGRSRMYQLDSGPASTVPTPLLASRSAVACFWRLLTDFVSLRSLPQSWSIHAPHGHPFIHFHPASASFVLNLPAAAAVP